MPDWQIIEDSLADCGIRFTGNEPPRRVGGGNISAAWSAQSTNGRVFLKTEPAVSGALLSAEADGLRELASAQAVAVPEVIVMDSDDSQAWLVLEWLELAPMTAVVEQRLGSQLAALHRTRHAQHGWHRDNWIGRTPQCNQRCADWITFYREQRLGSQLELAADNGYAGELTMRGARLLERIDEFFDSQPEASLLHGDLWAGNRGASDGEPVIFDPAVYYGDRETDLAMSRLFGGFGDAFYEAYRQSWPLAAGHERRQTLYQLYHVLNHLNLFGGGYHAQALAMINTLI